MPRICLTLQVRTWLPVIAGLMAATALYNALPQRRAACALRGGLDDLRAVDARTYGLHRRDPRTAPA